MGTLNQYLPCMKTIIFSILLFLVTSIQAQQKTFRFAFLSDTHIGSPDGKAEEDLRRTVADINQMTDIAFVVITGDITELGTNEEIKRAKQILDELKVHYYIIPGNHVYRHRHHQPGRYGFHFPGQVSFCCVKV